MKEKIVEFALYFTLGVIVAIIINVMWKVYEQTHQPEVIKCVADEFGRGCG